MNKENCALKLVDEIILYYDARSKERQILLVVHFVRHVVVALVDCTNRHPVNSLDFRRVSRN